jgi:flavin-dependent dehydrogenase
MSTAYDVVIIGGAFSGSSEGILLKRARPDARVLIVEPRTAFDRKVGESTSDVAGCFLTRVLRQHSWLVRHQLPKQGLRFWYNTPDGQTANDDVRRCGEIGSYFQVRLPTFQLDRSTLDEHLLEEALAAGCDVWRPAKVKGLSLGGAGRNTLDIERDGELLAVQARWVVDASGKAAVLARKHATLRLLEEHPTSSMWVRFRGVGDLDSWKAGRALGESAVHALPTSRMMATNHLSGHGWWCWLIPLKNGELSAGLTWDTRLFTPPQGGSIGQRLKAHLLGHPIGRLLFEKAEPIEQDARAYSQLAYFNDQAAGDGWACIGDAAGFMDPLYSQGLDYCAHTAYAVHKIVLKSLDGMDVTKEVRHYAADYKKSYHRWYRALYKGKYEYLGDLELMWPAFLLDLSTYFTGPVYGVYSATDTEFSKLPYIGPGGTFFAWWMRLYNQRLAALARKRRAAGIYGRGNLDRRLLLRAGFAPGLSALKITRAGLWEWAKLEAQSVFLKPLPAPPPATAPEAAAPAPAPAREIDLTEEHPPLQPAGTT